MRHDYHTGGATLIEETVRAIDRDAFRDAFQEILEPYECALPDRIPVEAVLRDREWYTSRGIPIHGCAGKDLVHLYPKSIARLRMRGIDLSLAALRVFTHEQAHHLAEFRIFQEDFCGIEPYRYSVQWYVFGFLVGTIGNQHRFYTAQPDYAAEFVQFNEGMVEIISRMLFNRFVSRNPPRHVSRHILDTFAHAMEYDDHVAYYPNAAQFVRNFVSYTAGQAGASEHTIWKWLFQAYMQSTELRTCPAWNAVSRTLPADFTRRVSSADHDSIAELSTRYFEARAPRRENEEREADRAPA